MVRAAELGARFERVGYRRSRLAGVTEQTRGFHVRQVYGTQRVRVTLVDGDEATGTALTRLCDLWGFVVVPLSRDTFEVADRDAS